MDTTNQRYLKFINKAQEIHSSKYDYSLVEYKNVDTKVIILCPNHGEFKQTPYKHASEKQGCPKCKNAKIAQNQKMPLNVFLRKAKEIHGLKYDYSLVEYKNAHTKIKIVCHNHGPFLITPNNHLYGFRGRGGKIGCPACSNNVSHAGQEWIDNFKNPNIEREIIQYIGNKKYKFDGFDKANNTVYEYFGSFWHGNPEKFNSNDINPRTKTTFGELYKATISKIEAIRNAGYNLIFVWEY